VRKAWKGYTTRASAVPRVVAQPVGLKGQEAERWLVCGEDPTVFDQAKGPAIAASLKRLEGLSVGIFAGSWALDPVEDSLVVKRRAGKLRLEVVAVKALQAYELRDVSRITYAWRVVRVMDERRGVEELQAEGDARTWAEAASAAWVAARDVEGLVCSYLPLQAPGKARKPLSAVRRELERLATPTPEPKKKAPKK